MNHRRFGLRTMWLTLLSGCTMPPPMYGLETPSSLPPGHTSATVGAGVAGNTGCCTPGAALRFRLGVDGRNEIGFDGLLIVSDAVAEGLKVAYKITLNERLALTAGLGATYHGDSEKHASVGADVGVVALLGHVRADVPVFAGLRVSASRPVWTTDIYKEGGVGELVTLPIGASFPLASQWRFLGEVGGLGAIVTSRTTGSRSALDDSIKTGTSFGFYGAIAIEWSQ